MIFRQLFDATSSTYTYLLADEHSRQALLIDPVFGQSTRDLALIHELGLTLTMVVDTHAHADHITAAWLLKQKTGCLIASAQAIGAKHVDCSLRDGEIFGVSGVQLKALSTPGHTAGCMSFVLLDESIVFTGDTLLIRGCGRSDFQEGSAHQLFDSITNKLFALPDDCLVYPAHDYQGRTVSSIGEEKRFNARLGAGANETDFVQYMQAMQLPHPKIMDAAVPANLRSGEPASGQLPESPTWGEVWMTYGGVPEVAFDWLLQHLHEVTLLDVRLPEEIIETQLPQNWPLLQIPLHALQERVHEVSQEQPIITVCRSGRRSALAVTILKNAGFERVASLSRGLREHF